MKFFLFSVEIFFVVNKYLNDKIIREYIGDKINFLKRTKGHKSQLRDIKAFYLFNFFLMAEEIKFQVQFTFLVGNLTKK